MDKLWIMAITGRVLIILLIIIRSICYSRIKNQTFVFMWLIVAVNLIIPISFDLWEQIETNSVLPKDIITDLSENLISNLNSAESIVAISENNFNFSNLIFYIWISGVLLLSSYFIISALRFNINSSKLITLSGEESLKLTKNSINTKRNIQKFFL
ncbi:MAG: M56 family metallopeptidase [Clostridia bacterium]